MTAEVRGAVRAAPITTAAPSVSAAPAVMAAHAPGSSPAPPTTTDRAFGSARGLYIAQHEAPVGTKQVEGRIRYKVQSGDTLSRIADKYNQAYHLNVTSEQIHNANRDVIRDPNRIYPSMPALEIPTVNEKIDTVIQADSPQLRVFDYGLRHQVASGETLSKIAAHYSAQFGVQFTSDDIKRANPDIVKDANVISTSMPPLRIPFVTGGVPLAEHAPTLSELDNRRMATRRAHVEYEDGSRDNIAVMRYFLNGSHAQRTGRSLAEAIRTARHALRAGEMQSTSAAIVQTRSGAFWVGPVRGEEQSDNLGDDQRTLGLWIKPNNPALKAWVELGPDGEISKRVWN